MNQNNQRRVLILTALPVEFNAVAAHLSGITEDTHPGGDVYSRGNFATEGNTWNVLLAEFGPGSENAAALAMRAIEYFQPDVALFVGVAGGIKDVKLGDVIAATKVYGYESGKDEEIFRPRPELGNSHHALVQRARAEARKQNWQQRLGDQIPQPPPRVFVAPIAAGAKVVASTRSATYQFLRQNYGDALAVEMEGFGFSRAVLAAHPVQALVVRGISDLIDKKAEADAGGFQEIAARHAAAFALEVLAQFMPAPPSQSTDTPSPTRPDSADLSALRQAINRHFNLSELRTLCFDLGIDYEELDTGTKSDFITALVRYCQRHQRLNALQNYLQRARPFLSWSDLFTD